LTRVILKIFGQPNRSARSDITIIRKAIKQLYYLIKSDKIQTFLHMNFCSFIPPRSPISASTNPSILYLGFHSVISCRSMLVESTSEPASISVTTNHRVIRLGLERSVQSFNEIRSAYPITVIREQKSQHDPGSFPTLSPLDA
jgi:hypothetical protein